jgi:LytS/YehU family sensor histidine kinase
MKIIRKKNYQLDEAYLLLEESKKFELAASNLKALKAQMNPHFIFNALNSIQDLILKNEKETSYDYIVLFAELVRSSLNNSNNEFIPIEEEVEFLGVYLKLEKLRFGEEFNYELITNDIDNLYIPSLIIQPFLENALLHGLMHKKGEKNLTIEFKLEKELLCIVTDNGVGREEAKRIKQRRGVAHESFAMNTIEERLNLLSEQFDYKYQFKVEDLYQYDIPVGTKIILSIPYKEEYYQN